MKNKKGFTLIELLAVIVILAILLVIAVPKILNVIDSARANAWQESTALVKHAIEVNTQAPDPSTGVYKYTVDGLCSNTLKISEIVDLKDMDITCNQNNAEYVFDLKGKGQFNGRKSTITCNSNGKCESNIVSNDGNSSSSETSNKYVGYFWSDVDTSGYSYDGVYHGLEGWNTTLNPEARTYLRTDGTTPEVCAKFKPNDSSLFCMTSTYYNPTVDSYESEFENCKKASAYNSKYNGTGEICLTGVSKELVDGMLSKGAEECMIIHNGAGVSCWGDDENYDISCNIYYSGSVECISGSGFYLNVNSDGQTY